MPLLMSQGEWARLVKWTDENKEDPEVARRREYLKRMDAQSRAMTKSWPNSLENVNKRNEELRRARNDKAEQANFKFYRRYVKRQNEEQERLMYNARNTIFKNKDAPKMLLSAVIESVVLKEREEQLKFERELKREEEEVKRAEDEAVQRKAKEWHALQEGKVQKRREVNMQHEKDMLKFVNEKKERERREAAEELARELHDHEVAEREMEAIREHQEMLKEKSKKRIKDDLEQSRLDLETRRREQEARSKMDDQLLEVIDRSRHAIECRRKKTEREAREEKLRILQQISDRLVVGTSKRDAKEQASLDKAQAEKTADIEARHKAVLDKKAKIKADRIAEREKFLREEEQRMADAETTLSWEHMNRFKNAELYEDYKESLRKEKERKIQEFRTDILKQWEECDAAKARVTAETKEFYGEATTRKFRRDDDQLFAYAQELLREAREHGRPERPILKAVDRYCRHHRLYPLPPLPAPLQRHFPSYTPRGGSGPRPDYRPRSPPALTDQAGGPDGDEDGRCNGLQDLLELNQKKKPKEKEVMKEEPVKGPTNGLQSKQKVECKKKGCPSVATQGGVLPYINIIPCCLCEK